MRNTHLCERAWVAQIADDPFKMSLPFLIFFFFFWLKDWILVRGSKQSTRFFFQKVQRGLYLYFPSSRPYRFFLGTLNRRSIRRRKTHSRRKLIVDQSRKLVTRFHQVVPLSIPFVFLTRQCVHSQQYLVCKLCTYWSVFGVSLTSDVVLVQGNMVVVVVYT